jgi:hypothetical protein
MKPLIKYTDEERKVLFDKAVVKDIEAQKKRARQEIEAWNNLKPFKNIWDVPDIPQATKKLYKEFYVPRLIAAGAIPKKDLIDGQVYIGRHRRCIAGKWNASIQVFLYNREKWGGTITDDCRHFEDDNGFALFVPIRLGTEEEWIMNKEIKLSDSMVLTCNVNHNDGPSMKFKIPVGESSPRRAKKILEKLIKLFDNGNDHDTRKNK